MLLIRERRSRNQSIRALHCNSTPVGTKVTRGQSVPALLKRVVLYSVKSLSYPALVVRINAWKVCLIVYRGFVRIPPLHNWRPTWGTLVPAKRIASFVAVWLFVVH